MGKYWRLVFILIAGQWFHAAWADWSNTTLSWRYGTHFAEPYNPTDIQKHILAFTHASGAGEFNHFFNMDVLLSEANDPSFAGSGDGAQEIYAVYRASWMPRSWRATNEATDFWRGLGLTAGMDVNVKNDAGYNSNKRMWVFGPTLALNTPGFLNISLLVLSESNQPYNSYTGNGRSRFHYDTHLMLSTVWGIPFTLGGHSVSFEGFANLIEEKGVNEFGHATDHEINLDTQLMFEVGHWFNVSPATVMIGPEYQYWKNKFGNAGSIIGTEASTPMVRLRMKF